MTRAELDEQWTLLADGLVSRADAGQWARTRLPDADPSDTMVMNGLQLLAGVTGASVEPSLDEITRVRDAWRADCAAFDGDPAGWRRDRALWTLRGLTRDRPELAPQAAAVFVREGILTESEAAEIVGLPPAD